MKADESINYQKICDLIINDIYNKDFYKDEYIKKLFTKYVENYE